MDIPRLIPRKYYTIERAARMLRVEVEDIEHWISEYFIYPLVKYYSGKGVIGHITISENILKQLESPLKIGDLIKSPLCHIFIGGWSLGNDEDGISSSFEPATWKDEVRAYKYQITVSCGVVGYFELVDVASDINMVDMFISTQSMDYPVISLPGTNAKSDINFYSTLRDVEFTRKDILIGYTSLKKLHNLIYPEGNTDKEPYQELSELLREKPQEPKNYHRPEKKHTSEEAKLRALGLMAYFLSEKSQGLQYNGKPNAKQITERLNSICDDLDIPNIPEDIKKDISEGFRLISSDIPEKNKK